MNNIKQMPKVDLHCHLDGSVRPETVIELAEKLNIELPSKKIEIIKEMMIAPERCDSLVTYLTRFELPQLVMQCSEGLERITYELLEDAAQENVKYMEIRFAPLFHVQEGLKVEEVLFSVIKGIERGEEDFDIKANVIVSFMRHMSPESMIEVLDVVKEMNHKKIVAADLCGAENPGFAKPFVHAIQYAKEIGLNITIHAGETGSAQNIIDAIELLDAQRIGHGVYAKKMPEAIRLLKETGVFLEMCPKSNLDTKAIGQISDYPIKEYFDAGINVTLNTDNRTVSNTDSTYEIDQLSDVEIVDFEMYKKIYESSVKASFITDEEKLALMKKWN